LGGQTFKVRGTRSDGDGEIVSTEEGALNKHMVEGERRFERLLPANMDRVGNISENPNT
jgi:hypothetical protein